jgi:hypothetical protein
MTNECSRYSGESGRMTTECSRYSLESGRMSAECSRHSGESGRMNTAKNGYSFVIHSSALAFVIRECKPLSHNPMPPL